MVLSPLVMVDFFHSPLKMLYETCLVFVSARCLEEVGHEMCYDVRCVLGG